jgi:pimeloyl-ACP methyl ester carboxylesterase
MTSLSSTLPALTEPKTWTWRGHSICYQTAGDRGTPVILIHGFGASWGHWRKNIPVLAQHNRVYAIDLIGFGGSEKPQPGTEIDYTMETWAAQVADFCREVVGEPALLIGNSIGCVVAMQTAVDYPEWVKKVAMLNCSLRLLHDRYRAELPWYRSVGASVLQQLLGVKWIGQLFFGAIAKPKVVRKILQQAYYHPEAVTDELIEILMKPAADPAAVDVFTAFTRYSQGPLPQDLLEKLPCSVLILWGDKDPWEPIALGEAFKAYACVEKFIVLQDAGHCPQDEVPDVVNPILQDWIAKS